MILSSLNFWQEITSFTRRGSIVLQASLIVGRIVHVVRLLCRRMFRFQEWCKGGCLLIDKGNKDVCYNVLIGYFGAP